MSWCEFVFRCPHLYWEAQLNLSAPGLGSWSCRWFCNSCKASYVCSPQVPKATSIVAQATVRSKAPLDGYISYTIGNTCIFQEVTSHSNTVATIWRRQKRTQHYTAVFQQRAVIRLWWLLWRLYYLERFVSLYTSQQSLKNVYLPSHPVLAWYTGCVSLTTRGTSIIHVHLFSAFLSDIIP